MRRLHCKYSRVGYMSCRPPYATAIKQESVFSKLCSMEFTGIRHLNLAVLNFECFRRCRFFLSRETLVWEFVRTFEICLIYFL